MPENITWNKDFEKTLQELNGKVRNVERFLRQSGGQGGSVTSQGQAFNGKSLGDALIALDAEGGAC